MRETILEEFAGPADTGIFSPSVQKTLYDTQKSALAKIPQVQYQMFVFIKDWITKSNAKIYLL